MKNNVIQPVNTMLVEKGKEREKEIMIKLEIENVDCSVVFVHEKCSRVNGSTNGNFGDQTNITTTTKNLLNGYNFELCETKVEK